MELTTYEPFKITSDFGIRADIELLPAHMALFASYDYEPNGYCWEDHIIQILEKVNPALLSHIDFDPEAGGFYAYADSEEKQLEFVKTLSPIFQDLETLEQYISSADRDRVDD
ncbi:Imm51 family immunity protein [Siphonobacter sp. SORGH_AS_1065]|uniref:Imm51 family immunity protein n=1 Tax=Siphonobacter sp. SORGH_AS_1065 TaxID=3041795 RepID=UPI00277F0B90|nr:Imm51 family immunity protein [Siphonobacter sp. SORGH_AS_1065]MDQ1089793.1 hypothetical protein [Siphonobacter sp. SORGH_AS_1065]